MKLRLWTKNAFTLLTLIISVVILLSGTLLFQFRASISKMVKTDVESSTFELVDQLKSRGELLTRYMSEDLVNPVYRYDMETLYENLNTVKKQKDVAYAYIYDAEGRIIHDGTEEILIFDKVFDDEVSKKAVAAGSLLIQVTEDVVDVNTPIRLNGDILGGLRIGFSLDGINEDIQTMKDNMTEIRDHGMQRNFYAILIITAGFSILAVLVSLIVARRLSIPIEILSSLTTRIGRGEYDVEIPIQRSDEIGELAASFIKMTSNLQETTVSRDLLIEEVEERRKAEEEMRQAKEEAEEATKLKDKFVSLVSHDLRAPIATISGFLQLLHEQTFDPEKQKMIIKEVLNVCDDMTALTSDILNMSRIKGGEVKPEFAFTDANQIVECGIQRHLEDAKRKGVRLINSMSERTRVYADKGLLLEVVSNLLSNAVKFCRKGDTVKIYVPDGGPSTITVADSGVGIEAERIESIFRYETKGSTAGTSGETGTGFGLPLSRDIMVSQGGDLRVESVVGKGSTFYAKLPHVRPKVLIIDDDKLIRSLLKDRLEGLDVDFLEAGSGEEAFNILGTDTVHLIFLDIIMPGMDGFTLLEHLKKKTETRDVPVIVITVDKKVETRERVFQLGADDYVTKPFEPEDLMPRVRRFVG